MPVTDAPARDEVTRQAKPQRRDRLYVWLKERQVYGGKAISKGQVVTLGNYPNDAKLIDLGYLQLLPLTAEPVQCMRCAARFLNDSTLALHESECGAAEVEIAGLQTDAGDEEN